MLSAKEQLEIIKRGAAEVIVEADLLKKLERSVAPRMALRIKAGWRSSVAASLRVPLVEVDAHNIVPARYVSAKQEFGAYTLRPKLNRLLSFFLTPFPSPQTAAGLGRQPSLLYSPIMIFLAGPSGSSFALLSMSKTMVARFTLS